MTTLQLKVRFPRSMHNVVLCTHQQGQCQWPWPSDAWSLDPATFSCSIFIKLHIAHCTLHILPLFDTYMYRICIGAVDVSLLIVCKYLD